MLSARFRTQWPTAMWLALCWLQIAVGEEVNLDATKWAGVKPSDEVAKEGLAVAKWDQMDRVRRVDIEAAPREWSRFRTLRFWAYCPAKKNSLIHLIVASENPATQGGDYYSLAFRTQWVGWRRFEVPLSRLGVARKPLGWSQITGVFFSSNWAHHLEPGTVLYLAGFSLSTDALPGHRPPPPDECLPNGSFEHDSDFDGRPDGWGGGAYRTKAVTNVDDSIAAEGKVSVRITSPAKSERGGWSHSIRDAKKIHPGMPYFFEGYSKTKRVEERYPGVCARITFVNTKGKVSRTDYVKARVPSDDWRKVEGVVLMPKDTLRFNVVLFLVGSGEAWWDAVSLKRLAGRVEVVAPQPGACCEDTRPVFRWNPVKGALSYTLECSADAMFDRAQRLEGLKETRAVLPEPVRPGATYHWRVRAHMPDGSTVFTLVDDPSAGAPRFPTFFSGTWRLRCQAAVAKLEAYRSVYARLAAFAKRNKMWDEFARLQKGMAGLERITSSPSRASLNALSKLDEEFADLDLFVNWWRVTFLGDKEFLARIDFKCPGLENARTAYEAGDLERAKSELVEHFRRRTKPVYFLNTANRPAPNSKRTADKRSEQILTHKYTIHSYKEPTFDLGRDLNWHVNPIVDREWPTQLHRHRHWGFLSSAYWTTHNERYAQELKQQLLDWVKDNPIERWDPRPGRNRFAWSTLNAASRMIHAWPYTYLRCRQSPAFDVDTAIVFLKMVREHGEYLMTHQARGGNWLIAESNALAAMGTLFPEFKDAGAWRNKGYGRLAEQLFAQTFDDGVHVERTPGYHSGCISLFLTGLQLAMMNQVEFDGKQRYVERIEKMYDFYLYGAKPNRIMPMLGDVGPMKVHGVLGKAARMFHRPDMQFVATEGKEGVEPAETSHAFAGSGLYVMRSDWRDKNALHLFLDCGGFYGHCHHDIFHMDVYAYGRTLLADAGRYAYAASINQYFRGTIGHNTVLIDRQNQAREPAPECLAWTTCEQFDYLHGRHVNYPGIVHERKVLFFKPAGPAHGYWVVVDSIAGEGAHRCDQRFHFDPALPAKFDGLQARSTLKDEANIVLASPTSQGLSLTKEDGWVSYRWYQKQPTIVAQYTREGPLPHRFETVLYPLKPGNQAKAAVESLRSDGEITALNIKISDKSSASSDTVIFQHAGARSVSVGDIETDADAAYLRADARGQLVRALMCGGSRLVWRGTTVLAAPEKLGYAAVDYDRDKAHIVATPTPRLHVHCPEAVTQVAVNGRAAAPRREAGVVDLTDVRAPAKRPVPRGAGPPVIEYEIPSQEAASLASLPTIEEKAVAQLGDVIRIEAEDFAAEGGGKLSVSITKVAASGKAVLNWDAEGHWIEWRFRVPKQADYFMVVKAATAKSRALRCIEIDSKLPVPKLSAVEFPYTGGYCNTRDDWDRFIVGESRAKPVLVRLDTGEHVLRMTNVSGDSLNLDYVLFAPR